MSPPIANTIPLAASGPPGARWEFTGEVFAEVSDESWSASTETVPHVGMDDGIADTIPLGGAALTVAGYYNDAGRPVIDQWKETP